MREAPALAGVTGSSPRSGGPRRAKTPPPRGGRQGSLLGRAFSRPGVTIAGAAFAALMTGIVANAVLFQKGRHPSPLFGAAHDVAAAPARAAIAPAPSAAPAPTPVAMAEPSAAPMPAHSVAPAAASAVTAKPAHAGPKKPAAAHAHVDRIGQLIGGPTGSGHQAKPQAVRPVVAHAKAAPKPHHAAADSVPTPPN